MYFEAAQRSERQGLSEESFELFAHAVVNCPSPALIWKIWLSKPLLNYYSALNNYKTDVLMAFLNEYSLFLMKFTNIRKFHCFHLNSQVFPSNSQISSL